MKYMGSKSRIARHIVPIIQEYVDQEGGRYFEPFVGGANVIDKIVCGDRIACDINEPLIAMLRHTVAGGVLPETVTREEYNLARTRRDIFAPWFIGCAGFLASYNGKFFGGYAGIVNTKIGTQRNYYDESRRNLLSQAAALSGVRFMCADYRRLKPRGGVVYCDPPYAATTGYEGTGGFDHAEFWELMREWSKKSVVLISEQTAPDDFKCIWEGEVTRTNDNASRFSVTEKLFKYAG